MKHQILVVIVINVLYQPNNVQNIRNYMILNQKIDYSVSNNTDGIPLSKLAKKVYFNMEFTRDSEGVEITCIVQMCTR